MFKTLKDHALPILKKNWLVMTVAVFIATVIPEILLTIYDYINHEVDLAFSEALLSLQENPSYLTAPDLMLRELLTLINNYRASLKGEWLTWVADFTPYVFAMAISGGFLKAARTGEVTAKDFASKMKFVGSSVLIAFIQSVMIGLGMVLFIAPGIYLAFAYSMVFYVRLDNPKLSIRQCFKRSRELMRGHKMRLFNHFFSFIGWYIVAGVASMLVSELLSAIASGIVIDILIAIFTTAIIAFVEAYWNTAMALYYEFNFVRPPVEPQPTFTHTAPDPFDGGADPFDGATSAGQGTQQAPSNDEPFEF